ncbi:hypothetical protein P9112_012886 [Eukaryota sp. TZLM1-RC]
MRQTSLTGFFKPSKSQPSLSPSEFSSLLEGLEESNMTADVSGIEQNSPSAIELSVADSDESDRNLVLASSYDQTPHLYAEDKYSFSISQLTSNDPPTSSGQLSTDASSHTEKYFASISVLDASEFFPQTIISDQDSSHLATPYDSYQRQTFDSEVAVLSSNPHTHIVYDHVSNDVIDSRSELRLATNNHCGGKGGFCPVSLCDDPLSANVENLEQNFSESVNNSESPLLPSEDSPIQLYHQPVNPSQRYGLGFGYQQGPLVTEPVRDISHPPVCPSDLDSSPIVSFDANDDGDESNPIILPDDSGHMLESNASSDMDVNVNPLEIYTDGSFLKKSNKSGFGGFYTFKDKRFEIYGPSRYNTHNAADVALSLSTNTLSFFSDSSLVVDSLNLKASLKNPTVKRIRSQIKDLINSSRFRLFSFSFKKVLAHSDNTNNNVADVLAKRGANGSECSLLKYLRTRYHVLEGPIPLCSLPPDHCEHIADSAPLDSFNLEKSHNCPICPSFFSKARTLCCHIDKHHSSIDTDTLHINNLVRCPVCLKVFSSVGFDNHFKRHESPTLDMPCISDSLFIQLSNEIASFTYKRLSDRPSFRSAVKLVTHSSLPMEQKCRYLLVLPVVCLKAGQRLITF